MSHTQAQTLTASSAGQQHGRFWTLTLGAVGVVYGDIGTSPLYALRESMKVAAEGGLTHTEILGVVSLLLWALVMIVTLKYVLFLLRADNQGEGGVLSLLALVQAALGKRTTLLLVLGIVGASLFFGDAIITPAISVLSAIEGIAVATPIFQPYVLPISLVLLFALFAVQFRGTGSVSALFGPITLVWFLILAVGGIAHILTQPAILYAINPYYAALFFVEHGVTGFVVLGAIFLAVTGAEALYADLGHFGRGPIQTAWLMLVFPALSLNYLGQGALVWMNPAALKNPFYLMVPSWGVLPLVLLAAMATLIASQAVITGAYSLAQQAIQLGLLPRLDIRHTSAELTGQIYMPLVNWMMLVGVVVLVLMFGSSDALASAYGIAVTGTMLITTALAFMYLRDNRHWPLAATIAAIVPFAVVETLFMMANLLKIAEGGYVPILVASGMALVMSTWAEGTAFLFNRARRGMVPLKSFIESIEKSSVLSIPGTAVFLTSDPESAPPALRHNLKHNRVLHEQVIILTIATEDVPRIEETGRAVIEKLSDRFVRVKLRFGYMETPQVSKALALCRKQGLKFDIMTTSFFLSRRKLISEGNEGMPAWRDRIFILLTSVAADPSDYFQLPRDRVVELGTQMIV